MEIKFIDLGRQYEKYKQDVDQQIQEVLDSSAFIMGAKVQELEQKLAEFVGVEHAVGCASGTDALLLALMALGVKAGDEIITTPFTFIGTAEVIAFLGAIPVFVDIRDDTYNIDSQKIQNAVTERTKGIIAVDLFGQCADYEDIQVVARANNLSLIADGAQSFGGLYKSKRSCSLGDIGCTSFFPAKSFGCYGDGGMVFTNDTDKAQVMASIRQHGAGKDKYDNVRIGLNSRLDAIQAAVLLAKFKYFAEEIELRQVIADYYTKGLQDTVKVPTILDGNKSVFSQYCIQAFNREELISHMKSKNIPTAIHYPRPLHLQKAFSYLECSEGDYPIAEEVSKRILALPMHPYISQQEQDHVIDTIVNFYK